jgi:hypothetical protein
VNLVEDDCWQDGGTILRLFATVEQRATWISAGDDPSAFDLTACFRFGRNIKGRSQEIPTLGYAHRTAVRPKQGPGAGVLLQQEPHGQSHRLRLVPMRQPFGGFLNERHDFRAINDNHICHGSPSFIMPVTT